MQHRKPRAKKSVTKLTTKDIVWKLTSWKRQKLIKDHIMISPGSNDYEGLMRAWRPSISLNNERASDFSSSNYQSQDRELNDALR